MNIKSKQVTKLKGLLYSRTESGRNTINQAVAYAVVMKTDILDNSSNVRMSVKDIVNEICELAILDRVALEKAVMNMYMFTHIKECVNNRTLVIKYPIDFETAMMITELLGKTTRCDVDENMELFNSIVNTLSTCITDIVE